MRSSPTWVVRKGAICKAKVMILWGEFSFLCPGILKAVRGPGAESLSNSGRNLCSLTRRTLGYRTTYRGDLLLNTKSMAIDQGVKGSWDNATTGQKFRLSGE